VLIASRASPPVWASQTDFSVPKYYGRININSLLASNYALIHGSALLISVHQVN